MISVVRRWTESSRRYIAEKPHVFTDTDRHPKYMVARLGESLMIRPPIEPSAALARGLLFTMHQILMADGPQTGGHADQSSAQCDPVCLGVAPAAHKALHMALLVVDLAVGIVDPTVQQVEDVARDNRREGHGAPVLTQTVHPEAMCHQARVYAEEDTVGKAREPRHEDQEMWVIDYCPCDLCEAENDGGDEKTPES